MNLGQRILTLGKGMRIQFEKVSSTHVLLYPEGCVDLNDSAAKVLKMLPSSVYDLEKRLRQEHGVPQHENLDGFDDFVQDSILQGWVREEKK